MFQFNFLQNANKVHDSTTETTDTRVFIAKEVCPSKELIHHTLQEKSTNIFNCKDTQIKYVTSSPTKLFTNKVNNLPVLQAEISDSDLLTGVYEGGLKIWECTHDLASFISEEKIDLKNKIVLDLGCGTGIIGILALLKGSTVYFQDYNEEIINFVTIPNVHLNSKPDLCENCKFYYGDWSSFITLTNDLRNEKADIIFTCETIYNVSNYKKLHEVFKECLKPDGVIYLAAKTYYFGVGGGLREFEDYISQQGIFNFSTCWKCTKGLQREILKITFKS